MSRIVTGVMAVLATAAIAACGSPAPSPDAVLHIANRSNTALAIAPDVLIPSCGSVSLTPAAYEAARTAGANAMMDGTWEVPAGSVWWNGFAIAGDPVAGDVTFVISGTAPLAARNGVIAEADLPPCGGAPVGILDEVVPEPGAPDGPSVTIELP